MEIEQLMDGEWADLTETLSTWLGAAQPEGFADESPEAYAYAAMKVGARLRSAATALGYVAQVEAINRREETGELVEFEYRVRWLRRTRVQKSELGSLEV